MRRARANGEVADTLQDANDQLKVQSDAIAPNLRASVDTLSATLASQVLGVSVGGTPSGAVRRPRRTPPPFPEG